MTKKKSVPPPLSPQAVEVCEELEQISERLEKLGAEWGEVKGRDPKARGFGLAVGALRLIIADFHQRPVPSPRDVMEEEARAEEQRKALQRLHDEAVREQERERIARAIEATMWVEGANQAENPTKRAAAEIARFSHLPPDSGE